jgi:hypothetical protein
MTMTNYSPKRGESLPCSKLAQSSSVVWEMPGYTLIQRLQERRISLEVIQAFGILPKNKGWEYPTPGGGLRWKNADSKGKPKYRWNAGKSEPASALYYHDDLLLSVQASGGVCFFASGEPDLWALRSAGIANAFCGFSENTVNPGLAEKLQSMGVRVLYIFPDLDKAGKRWAGKGARVIRDSGIELHCKRLPDSLGERGDIGKMWELYAKPAEQFERDLLALPRWYPTPEIVKEPKKATFASFADSDIPAGYRQPIAQALGVESYNAKDFSNVILCVFHDDHSPQAYLGYAGLYCHACGTTYNWNALGEQLGFGTLADYYKHHPSEQVATVVSVAPVIVGLTLESLQGLVSCRLVSLARVLYVLYSNGWDEGQIVTVKDIKSICLAHGIKERAVREAMSTTRGELPKNKKAKNEKANSVLRFFSLYSLQHSTEKKSAKPKKLPNNEQVYRLPKRGEIAEALDIRGNTPCLIPPDALRSPKKFRAAIYAEQIRKSPGRYTRKQLTEPLGISAPTARVYDDLEGIDVSANWKRAELTPKMTAAMPKTYHNLRIARKERLKRKKSAKYAKIEAIKKGGTSGLETGKANKTSRLFCPCQESVARAYEFAGEGGKVEEVKSLANNYKSSRKNKEEYA